MIPGMWQVIFSLGVFSSCRFLPRPVAVVGAWYLLTGLTCISLADNRALSPWAMAFRMEPPSDGGRNSSFHRHGGQR